MLRHCVFWCFVLCFVYCPDWSQYLTNAHSTYVNNLPPGIQRAREILMTQGRADAPSVIIVVTDGKSSFPRSTHREAQIAKVSGMLSVYLCLDPDREGVRYVVCFLNLYKQFWVKCISYRTTAVTQHLLKDIFFQIKICQRFFKCHV